MNIFFKYRFFLLSFMLVGCASQQKNTVEEIEKLDKLIAKKSFEIRPRWARPLVSNSLNSIANAGLLPLGSTANQIDLMGTSSHFRILGDSVMAKLPYFGERQMGAAYNSTNGGIQFSGIPKNLKIKKQDSGKGYKIDFQINNNTETYNVSVNLHPNLQSRINVNSSHRNMISYSGQAYAYSTK
ncbi:DUF4251 domain-containing protein [Flagellimonas sp. HMM57]|uniref:DUF4251 domain-containing protein n=1 Tax=unclassified Flagellimonas TaxID=2644544 RepID=UPI0013CFD05C|nr:MULTISPECIES: DUF4251 domain-containing protein [unclassified Flagellimonas]UII75796.1 DUF4251 domain-containing protein [Flagellimonas sp. HMM57]